MYGFSFILMAYNTQFMQARDKYCALEYIYLI